MIVSRHECTFSQTIPPKEMYRDGDETWKIMDGAGEEIIIQGIIKIIITGYNKNNHYRV